MSAPVCLHKCTLDDPDCRIAGHLIPVIVREIDNHNTTRSTQECSIPMSLIDMIQFMGATEAEIWVDHFTYTSVVTVARFKNSPDLVFPF